MVTVGLDLHQRNITDCALDDAGTVLAEHRRLEHSLDALGRWLGELAQPAARAGGRWAALYTTDCDMKLAKTLQYVLVLTLAASPAPVVGSVGAQTVRDSAGVRVVLYAASARPAHRWSLDPKPLLEIGGADARGVTEFTEIRGVVRLSDGRVAVANGATNEIRIFDSTGAFQGTAGRAGSGPGEFRRLLRLFRFGEYLAGVDGDTRVQVFSAEGRLVRSLQPVRLEGMRNPQRVGVLTDGGTVLFATKGTQRAAGEETMYAYSVFRGQPDGDSLIPLFEVPGYREVRFGQAPGRVLLDAEGSVAARANRICAGFSNRFEVTCYDTSGAARVRIRREITVRRVTEADRALVRAAYLAANRDAPPAVRQAMERATLAFRFAEHAPAFGRLVLAETGELWVSDFDPRATLPGPPALLAPKRPQHWSVFSADGTWLADIVLPARFLAYEMGRDYVAGVVVDEDDVEHVTLFRLRR